jgi:hypothetical protein
MENNFVKITGAAYRLLDLFPEGDPLKNKAKEKVLEILDKVTLIFDEQGWVSLKKYLLPDREKIADQLLGDIEILENYFKIAKYERWIDDLNFFIITGEYNAIKQELAIKRGTVVKAISQPSQVLPEKEKTNLEILQDNQAKVSFNSQISDLLLRPESALQQEVVPVIQGEEEGVQGDRFSMGRGLFGVDGYSSGQKPVSQKPWTVESEFAFGLAKLGGQARQQKILEILKERDKTQVADIIKQIPGITKRTIRRDLDELLRQGKIIRSGEWNQIFYQISKVLTS